MENVTRKGINEGIKKEKEYNMSLWAIAVGCLSRGHSMSGGRIYHLSTDKMGRIRKSHQRPYIRETMHSALNL